MVASCHFNPRSHERSDFFTSQYSVINVHFNPRSHERSDCDDVTTLISGKISIHAPTRGATMYSSSDGFSFCISIHAPTRGATMRFFIAVNINISIHAPTRGATLNRKQFIRCLLISIHAPTRGATKILQKYLYY